MKITVKGQQAIVTDDFLVANSVGIYECEFEFDSSWDGYAKNSVWQLNNDEPKESIISSGVAEVPWEVLVNGGFIRVGVYGTKDEKVMPTVWGEKRKVHLGTPTGSIGTEPTPSIYAQILAVADEAKEIAEDAYEIAETSQESAKHYAEKSEAWATGEVGGVPTSDETYHNNAKWWAEMAQQSAEESGFAWFDVDENTGEAIVTITDNLDAEVSFVVNTNTGELEVAFI